MRGVTRRHQYVAKKKRFLLTRLMRGVTLTDPETVIELVNFYSHASCEA